MNMLVVKEASPKRKIKKTAFNGFFFPIAKTPGYLNSLQEQERSIYMHRANRSCVSSPMIIIRKRILEKRRYSQTGKNVLELHFLLGSPWCITDVARSPIHTIVQLANRLLDKGIIGLNNSPHSLPHPQCTRLAEVVICSWYPPKRCLHLRGCYLRDVVDESCQVRISHFGLIRTRPEDIIVRIKVKQALNWKGEGVYWHWQDLCGALWRAAPAVAIRCWRLRRMRMRGWSHRLFHTPPGQAGFPHSTCIDRSGFVDRP